MQIYIHGKLMAQLHQTAHFDFYAPPTPNNV
jgi:hypothetical protein